MIGGTSYGSDRTRLLFATAGIVLEMLRVSGPGALLPYSVLILDEVHERSEQSDLVLACVRDFMLKDKQLHVGALYREVSLPQATPLSPPTPSPPCPPSPIATTILAAGAPFGTAATVAT